MNKNRLIGMSLVVGTLVIALVATFVFEVNFLTALALVAVGILISGLALTIGRSSRSRNSD